MVLCELANSDTFSLQVIVGWTNNTTHPFITLIIVAIYSKHSTAKASTSWSIGHGQYVTRSQPNMNSIALLLSIAPKSHPYNMLNNNMLILILNE